ncbi:hypothetical protein GCM10009117_25700 [Gangjinia marincola]|uniref:Uncharacterized protein n=1 Tax=Gangjinia marincola TaxID=578463 RepID=A0ABN1MJY1_9FLAO
MEHQLELETYITKGKLYKHNARSIVATEKLMMKNSSETMVEKEYISKKPFGQGDIFRVITHSETYGAESATEKLAKDLNSLISNIGVYTNELGYLEAIINKEEVFDKWHVLKKRWKKESSKEESAQVAATIHTVEENLQNGSFVREMTEQGALYFLFSGAYRSYSNKEPIEVKRDLNKFLVLQPLPLNITYIVEKYDRLTRKLVLKGKGQLAKDRLDQLLLNKMVRGIKDKINLKVELNVFYVEHLYFDQYGWLEKADQNVKVKIPGFYMTESEQKLVEIDRYE